MDTLTILDPVVLLTDVPSVNLRKGSLGTVVETVDQGRYLVEFADINGVSYAMPVLDKTQLMKVYQEPVIV